MFMRPILNAAVVLVLLVFMAVPNPAQATGLCLKDCPPPGFDAVRPIRHWVYYPRYWHHYSAHSATDPFAYRYEARGYYPGAGSHYWRHHYHPGKPNLHLPPYHQAWGYHRPAVRTKLHRRQYLPWYY
jgi:hypothetical protein